MIDYGTGIILTSIDETCEKQLLSWRNDYRIRKWTRQNDLLTSSDHWAWIHSLTQDKTKRMYQIKDDLGSIKGVCGLTRLDLINRNAEFSLYIGPEYHSQGFGRAALITLFSHGFNTYGLQSIWGETFDHNPALCLFVSIGMKCEGTRRNFYFRDGKFTHAHLYSLLAKEWEESAIFKPYRTQKCS